MNGADTHMINANEVLNTAKNAFCVVCTSPCNGACYKDTALEAAYEELSKADAIVIGSPVYYGTVSAQLKAFFDKSSVYRRKKAFFSTPCGIVTCAHSRFGGQETTIKTIHDMCLVQGMTIVGDGFDDCGHHGVCAVAPSIDDKSAIDRAKALAQRLIMEANKQ